MIQYQAYFEQRSREIEQLAVGIKVSRISGKLIVHVPPKMLLASVSPEDQAIMGIIKDFITEHSD